MKWIVVWLWLSVLTGACVGLFFEMVCERNMRHKLIRALLVRVEVLEKR